MLGRGDGVGLGLACMSLRGWVLRLLGFSFCRGLWTRAVLSFFAAFGACASTRAVERACEVWDRVDERVTRGEVVGAIVNVPAFTRNALE